MWIVIFFFFSSSLIFFSSFPPLLCSLGKGQLPLYCWTFLNVYSPSCILWWIPDVWFDPAVTVKGVMKITDIRMNKIISRLIYRFADFISRYWPIADISVHAYMFSDMQHIKTVFLRPEKCLDLCSLSSRRWLQIFKSDPFIFFKSTTKQNRTKKQHILKWGS